MSTVNAIKGIRSELARDIAAAQKSQRDLATQLRDLAANVKATEAILAAKVRFLASLDAIQREADAAFVGEAPRRGRKPGVKMGRPAKAEKVSVKPDEVKVRRKPGRKSKAEKAAELAAKKAERKAAREAKKAERATKKVAAPKKSEGAKVTKVRVGRQSSDQRPPIKEAIAKVLEGRVMSAENIFADLKAKGWLPNSNDPKQYISYLLSSTKDRFERVPEAGRGHYRCKGVKTAKAEKVETAPVEAVKERTANDILDEAGALLGVPFGG